MFLSNSMNNPAPYLKNEDDFTPLRMQRDQWNKGKDEPRRFFWKLLDDQPVANDRWFCHHLGQNDNIQMKADKQMERERKREMECSLREHVQKNTDEEISCGNENSLCNKYEPEREATYNQQEKDLCFQVPNLLEEADEMFKSCRTTTTGINPECFKVELNVPRMIPSETAPKFQVKSSKLSRVCGCTRKNGLQADCPMIECMGRPECLSQPVPLCKPSGTQELVRKVYEICCEYN